jgi:Zn-dependent protease
MGDGTPPSGYDDEEDLWDDDVPDGRVGGDRRGTGGGDGTRTAREGDPEWRSGRLVPEGADPSRARVLRDITATVERHFTVYDVEYDRKSAVFYYRPPHDVEEPFEELRKELRPEGFIPFLRTHQGESVIQIFRSPEAKPTSTLVNLLLLLATIFTTIWAGTLLWAGRVGLELEYGMEMVEYLGRPELVGNGALFFALPLMLILGIHEMGHYMAAKRHGVDASLPFFIPMPPPFFIGTMGAFISMREPIPSKKALMSIGAAGPIAGFIVAIPVTIAGMWLTINMPVSLEHRTGEFIIFNTPLIYDALATLFPSAQGLAIHPTAIAGWVGIFITGLNLLPAGQLDGGHVARALLGKKAYIASAMTVGILVAAGLITGFMMWFIFGLFILFLTGVRHPPPLNDVSGLGRKHYAIGIATIAIFAVSIHPVPLDTVTIGEPPVDFELTAEELAMNIAPSGGAGVGYTINLTNTGDDDDSIRIWLAGEGPGVEGSAPGTWDREGGWSAQLEGTLLTAVAGGGNSSADGNAEGTPDAGATVLSLLYPEPGAGDEDAAVTLKLPAGASVMMVLNVTAPPNASLGDASTLELRAVSRELEVFHPLDDGDDAALRTLTFTTTISSLDISPDEVTRLLYYGNVARFPPPPIEVRNLLGTTHAVNITIDGFPEGGVWNHTLTVDGVRHTGTAGGEVIAMLDPHSRVGLALEIWFGPEGGGEAWEGPAPGKLTLVVTVSSMVDGSAVTLKLHIYPVTAAV